jgi:hypothetical protein
MLASLMSSNSLASNITRIQRILTNERNYLVDNNKKPEEIKISCGFGRLIIISSPVRICSGIER